MKKRVLLVSCEGLGNGGVQAIMMGIVRKLSDNFHFDMLLFTSEKRYYDDEFLTFGGKIFRIPNYEGNCSFLKRIDYYVRDIRVFMQLKSIFNKEEPYDVIHCNREYENAIILKLAAKYQIPIRIAQAHIIHGKRNAVCTLLDNFRQKIANKYATERIGCSESACVSLFSKDVKYQIVNNFYNDDIFYPRKKEVETNKVLTLVQVGAISNIKNQKFSVEVLENIRNLGIDAKLRIIGFDMDGDYKQQVLNKIIELSLKEYVEFYPGDIEISHVLSTSDCFIMPSYHEGFGIALIEAQAVGLHSFASDTIPPSTNCGGVDYLSLSLGPLYWATKIVDWFKFYKPDAIDTSKYKMSLVINQYKHLYNK